MGERELGTRILVIEDDREINGLITETLRDEKCRILNAFTANEALAILRRKPEPDLVLLDLGLPDQDGMACLTDIKTNHPDLQVIVVTAFDQTHNRIEATQRGAYDFIPKPFDVDILVRTVEDALKKYPPSEEIANLQARLKQQGGSSRLVGTRSDAMREFVNWIGGAASPRASALAIPVLIRGDMGTGVNEAPTVAEIVHKESTRDLSGRFIVFDHLNIPGQLLAKEIRGTVPEAYKDAPDAPGIIEQANNGTLYIPDLADLEGYQTAQSTIVEILNHRPITRLGSTTPITNLDIRVIAFSSREPDELYHEGKLFSGLVYPWGIELHIPSLDQRRGDLPEHIASILNKMGWEKGINDEAVTYLRERNWPGNLQELENALMGASFKARGKVIGREHFQYSAGKTGGAGVIALLESGLTLPQIVHVVEDTALDFVMKETGENRQEVAERLGIPVKELDNLLVKHANGKPN